MAGLQKEEWDASELAWRWSCSSMFVRFLRRQCSVQNWLKQKVLKRQQSQS